MKKNNLKSPKKIEKAQSNGELTLDEEQKSTKRLQKLTGAVVNAIKEASEGMEELTFFEINAVLISAMHSYNKRGLQMSMEYRSENDIDVVDPKTVNPK